MTIPSNTMTSNNLVTLQTDGYELKFYLSQTENYKNSFFDAEVEFLVKPELLQQICVKASYLKISFDDLKRLLTYFKNHIQSLEVDANHESCIFIDYSLGYQIQASCGFVSSSIEESYFSVISMVNIGKINPSNSSTYVGGESTISFNQARDFIAALENLIASK